MLKIYINVCFVTIPSLCRMYIKNNSLRTQPKFIVFLSQILLLFKFCHSCKADNPLAETSQVGTMAVITSTCTNKQCNRRDTVWKSQPNMPGTKIPAGNVLLCMSILLSGSSASKVLQMFQHIGVACFSLKTFFKHQHVGYHSRILNTFNRTLYLFYHCNFGQNI